MLLLLLWSSLSFAIFGISGICSVLKCNCPQSCNAMWNAQSCISINLTQFLWNTSKVLFEKKFPQSKVSSEVFEKVVRVLGWKTGKSSKWAAKKRRDGHATDCNLQLLWENKQRTMTKAQRSKKQLYLPKLLAHPLPACPSIFAWKLIRGVWNRFLYLVLFKTLFGHSQWIKQEKHGFRNEIMVSFYFWDFFTCNERVLVIRCDTFPLDGLPLVLTAFQWLQEKQGLTELKFYPVTFPKIIEFLHANGCATFSKALPGNE